MIATTISDPAFVVPTQGIRDDIEAALRGVIDPELNADIVELGMVGDISVNGPDVSIGVALEPVLDRPPRLFVTWELMEFPHGVPRRMPAR